MHGPEGKGHAKEHKCTEEMFSRSIPLKSRRPKKKKKQKIGESPSPDTTVFFGL